MKSSNFVLLIILFICGCSIFDEEDFGDGDLNIDEDSYEDISDTSCVKEEERTIHGMVYSCKNGTWKLIRKTVLIGSSNGDGAQALAFDKEGFVYISGHTGGELDGYKNFGRTDAALVKLDNDLNKIWWRQWGTNYDEYGKSLAVDSDGFVYVAGGTWRDMDDQENKGEIDIFITKWNNEGEKIWTKLRGTSESESATSIDVDGENNIFVGVDASVNDTAIFKYNSNFEELYAQEFESSVCYFENQRIVVDEQGNAYISWESSPYKSTCTAGIHIAKIAINSESGWETKRSGNGQVFLDRKFQTIGVIC